VISNEFIEKLALVTRMSSFIFLKLIKKNIEYVFFSETKINKNTYLVFSICSYCYRKISYDENENRLQRDKQ